MAFLTAVSLLDRVVPRRYISSSVACANIFINLDLLSRRRLCIVASALCCVSKKASEASPLVTRTFSALPGSPLPVMSLMVRASLDLRMSFILWSVTKAFLTTSLALTTCVSNFSSTNLTEASIDSLMSLPVALFESVALRAWFNARPAFVAALPPAPKSLGIAPKPVYVIGSANTSNKKPRPAAPSLPVPSLLINGVL